MAIPPVTPNMNLTEPVVGGTLSPAWALYVNNNFTTLDQHDHSAGKGIQITPAGLNISTDLSFQTQNAINLRTSRYTPISLGSLTGVDLGAVFVSGVDLYYVDGSGNQVRITQSGGLAGTPGSIANLTPPASATYVGASDTFVWESNTGVAANMDAATLVVRYPSTGYPTPSGDYIALQAPSSTLGGYALTLPIPPSVQCFTTIDQTGLIANPIPFVAGITSTNIANATILGSNIAAATITGSNIAAATITGSNVASATISGSNIVSNVSLAGIPTSNGDPVVVCKSLTGTLVIIRGGVQGNGVIYNGEGFSCTRLGTGAYQVTYTTAFADVPAVTVTVDSSSALGLFPIAQVSNTSVNGFFVTVGRTDVVPTISADFSFWFHSIGIR